MLMAFPSWNYILRAFANMDIRNFYMSYKQNVEVYQYGAFDLLIAGMFIIITIQQSSTAMWLLLYIV